MNLTEDKFDNQDQEIDKNSSSEITINPKFYGNQTLDNLIELRLRVHNVLNVGQISLTARLPKNEKKPPWETKSAPTP